MTMTASELPAKSGEGQIARAWWGAVISPEKGDPGTRAQLRRCKSPMEALTIPGGVALARRLGAIKRADEEPWRLTAALGLAIVLAYVKEDDRDARLMQRLGWKKFPGAKGDEPPSAEDRPRLSEQRFRRLLLTDEDGLVPAFSRLVQYLNGGANVSDISESFLGWTHPWRGDRIRQRWAFDYYAAGAASPVHADPSKESE